MNNLMKKEDAFIVLSASILIISIAYFYNNIGSFECYVNNIGKSAMTGIVYNFEPNGSLYGNVKIYRFEIESSDSSLEYYGMSIKSSNGTSIFSEIDKEPDGGLITATVNVSDSLTVERYFKKMCYPEVRL